MAKAVMIQGVASGSGKSFITAGLCRVFHQDGWRTAPFKSQNMALNSFITAEGLEMGRAQVMQAEAAQVEPSAQMNPILLKPSGDMESQVIVNGRVFGTLPAGEYYRRKQELFPAVRAAYNALARRFDRIVLEGAGSPAEINLKKDDFVNMGMAKIAQSPVLLVGDIDRGGVFASLYGTIALLEPDEREMVKGLIINKFRGDPAILRPGLAQLESLTGVPVVGVLPYLEIDLEDEDSLAPRLAKREQKGVLDIAVIRLPHISNFTDFHALEQVEGVGVRYVTAPKELGSPDLALLPGTKSTMRDLLWLRQSGMEAALKKLAAKGTLLIGICGGYQILGETLRDPEGVEGGGELAGMGLLPVQTVFAGQKTRARTAAAVCPLQGPFAPLSGQPLEGYEIHMGISTGQTAQAFSLTALGRQDGAVFGNVLGSYLHGLFDSTAFTNALLQLLLKRKGLDENALASVDYRQYKETQYELLAQNLRKHLDLEAINRIVESGL
ncbi:MAG: cobyric acid synthase [Oscillospiraceae bacterium]|jgi:adenosylcobyric acid synthase